MTQDSQLKAKQWGIRIILAILVLVLYIFVWRPARTAWATGFTGPIILSNVVSTETTTQVDYEGRSIFFTYPFGDNQRVTEYASQTGFYFLLAIIGLLFVTFKLNYYLILTGFHLGIEILVWLFLLTGLHLHITGFLAADFLISYCSPLLSLAYIPIVYKLEKSSL